MKCNINKDGLLNYLKTLIFYVVKMCLITDYSLSLPSVFHSIRLRLRLTKIGCRETINSFFIS